MQKGFASLLILVGILVLAAVGGGAFYFGKFPVTKPQTQNPIVVSPIPQPLISASPVPAGTAKNPAPDGTGETVYTEVSRSANWKTYTNKDLGYSINLPPRWKLSDKLLIRDPSVTIEKFTFLSDNEIDQILEKDAYNPSFYLEIETRPNSQEIPLKTWITDTKYSPQSADQKIEDTNLNNQPAVKVLGNQGNGFVDYYLSRNGLVYDIGYYYLDNDSTWGRPTGFSKELFNQILSTFKFLP